MIGNFQCLLIICACAVLPAGSRVLYEAPPHARIEGSYFVRSHPSVTWDEIESLIAALHQKNDNASLPGFTAHVTGKAKNIAYGFSAKLSEEALKEVSISNPPRRNHLLSFVIPGLSLILFYYHVQLCELQ